MIDPQNRGHTDQRALPQLGQPVLRVRPGQLWLIRVIEIGCDGPQIDTHRTGPQCTHRQSECQRDDFAAFARLRRQPGRHVHIGGVQNPGIIEGPQQPAGIDRAAPMQGIVGHDRAHRGDPLPSSSSEIASTRSDGGRQLNTPAGCPSTTGVSGPHIPRRNRYTTPPRCRSGW